MSSSTCLTLSSTTAQQAAGGSRAAFYIEAVDGVQSQYNYRVWNFIRILRMTFLSLLLVKVCKT